MNVTTGTYATPNGARYVKQLCKHFSHEIETRCGETDGELVFDMGTAHLSADDTGLTVRFELHNDDAFEAAQGVIDEHVGRFAFREGFTGMDWDWKPPLTPRNLAKSIAYGTADTLRERTPGLHAFLKRTFGKYR